MPLSSLPPPFAETDFPADPYPGARPGCSFVQHDGRCFPLRPAPGGWRAGDVDLDDWLVHCGANGIAGRSPVLAYGSNACPDKIGWLRANLGLAGPVVVLRAECRDLAAVWAYGQRVRDDQRPVTLAALPGVVEWHAVWLATPEQVAVLDRCEGRGSRYHLARVHGGRVCLENGAVVGAPLAYVAATERRMPLLVAGRPVRAAEVAQHEVRELPGTPAGTHGLDVTLV
ncbi:hypothetical protein SAMN05421810_102631 [Amycolatopsis arida]|uniref:NHR domain-containing protein n=1 Tax=Amycolatopsis arida TaxID=587909 RepID=A0A1I5QGK4_9PSEU|nr:hypothetical protein [Amycolatopsis arida]TDX98835.1 hypothetical protein CLV69_101632 [Amycolatopsis arida]SFP45388.1 hypothetical protein SAMN05421810_102631 [Amycolatopsis arida]